MSGEKPELATIQNMDKPSEPPIKCMFNPKEYSIQKQNDWKEGSTPGHNVSQLEFGGGKPSTLQLQLFFDTYAEKKDVREAYVNAILKLMAIDDSLKDKKNKKGRPPRVMFQWGKNWSFEAVITTIKQQYSLFLSTGVPVRATLDVTFQELKDAKERPRQNPTSGGVGGERVWRVGPGDTLALIAYREYGDSNMWRLIADANRLTKVRELTPGTVLVIPNV